MQSYKGKKKEKSAPRGTASRREKRDVGQGRWGEENIGENGAKGRGEQLLSRRKQNIREKPKSKTIRKVQRSNCLLLKRSKCKGTPPSKNKKKRNYRTPNSIDQQEQTSGPQHQSAMTQ